MDPGFTNYFIFEFKNGVVYYKELDDDGKAFVIKSRVFCHDPESTRKIILRELLNLNSTSSKIEICKAAPRLPPLPEKRISQKKIDCMKVLYPQIPRSFRWYYPEGASFEDYPHTELRRRAALQGYNITDYENLGDPQDEQLFSQVSDGPHSLSCQSQGILSPLVDAQANEVSPNHESASFGDQSKRKPGRPPKKSSLLIRNQPSIHMFLGKRQQETDTGLEVSKKMTKTSLNDTDDDVDEVEEVCVDDEDIVYDCDIVGGDGRETDDVGDIRKTEGAGDGRKTEDLGDIRETEYVGDIEETVPEEQVGDCSGAENYSLDLNHSDGMIVLKLKKQ